MSLAVLHSRALSGMDAPQVTVEVHLANGLPSFTIVGLPETEVKEAKDRVRAALCVRCGRKVDAVIAGNLAAFQTFGEQSDACDGRAQFVRDAGDEVGFHFAQRLLAQKRAAGGHESNQRRND